MSVKDQVLQAIHRLPEDIDYPYLTEEDIRACLAFAADRETQDCLRRR